jgi:ubiquinone/menaquinone biosynthesis C-methylase UbiE
LKFKNEEFDVVTFCSVLFLVDDSTKSFLMFEALRVLKPGGKIIVLTPSGKKSRFTAFSEVWSFPFSRYNWTYIIWKTVTSAGGKKWQQEKWLASFSKKNELKYESILTFNDNASLEIITKK